MKFLSPFLLQVFCFYSNVLLPLNDSSFFITLAWVFISLLVPFGPQIPPRPQNGSFSPEASHSRPVGVTVRELNPFKFQHENDCFRMMGNWNRLLLLDYPSQLTVALVSCSLEDSPRAAISSNCKIRNEKFNRFILFERVIVPANQILLISRKQITNK